MEFSDALDELIKVMDKDTKYQKECIALLDEAQARDDLAMSLLDEERELKNHWYEEEMYDE